MRPSLALLSTTALLLPAAVVAIPAEAAPSVSLTIKNCSKTQHGVLVRIKMRDNGEFTRVRVSHPRGDGNFREPRVRQVVGSIGVFADGANSLSAQRTFGPSFRTDPVRDDGRVVVFAKFRLRNGESIRLNCTIR